MRSPTSSTCRHNSCPIWPSTITKSRLANHELEKTSQQKTEWLNTLEQQYNENQNFLNALAETYLTVYAIDLETDQYKTVKNDITDLSILPDSAPFSPTFRKYCDTFVHPEDRERLIQSIDPDIIARSFVTEFILRTGIQKTLR